VLLRAGPHASNAALAGSASAFLDEVSTAPGATFGTVVRSIALPSTAAAAAAVASGQLQLTLGLSGSQGSLLRSGDGRFLTLAGWGKDQSDTAAPGTSDPFTIAVCAVDGSCDTSTRSATLASAPSGVGGNNARFAATIDGDSFWTASTNGMEFERRPTAAGSAAYNCTVANRAGCNTVILASGGNTNVRAMAVFNGELYESTQSPAAITSHYTGAPGSSWPTSLKASNVIPVVIAATGTTPHGFAFIDANNVVVGDVSATSKLILYTNTAGTWSQAQVLGSPTNTATVRAPQFLAYDNCTSTLYYLEFALSGTDTTTQLWAQTVVVSAGGSATFGNPVNLRNATSLASYRGVAMAPGNPVNCAPPTPTATPSPSPSPVAGAPTSTPSPSPSPTLTPSEKPSPSYNPLPNFAPFTPGNLIVLRGGPLPGGQPVGGQEPVYLDEISTDPSTIGMLVQTINFPLAQYFVRGAGQSVVTLQTSQSQGGLARSDDGRFISFMGWRNDVSATAATSSASFTTVVCTANAVCDTSTGSLASPSGLGGNNARSAVTFDGKTFYASGTNGLEMQVMPGSAPGCTAIGPGCNVKVRGDNVRHMQTYGGAVYMSSQGAPWLGIATYGVGANLSAARAAAPPVFINTGAGSVPHGFAFMDDNNVLVANNQFTAAGGLQYFWRPDGASPFQLIFTINDIDNNVTQYDYKFVTFDPCTNTAYMTSQVESNDQGTHLWYSVITGRGPGATFSYPLFLRSAPFAAQYKGVAIAPGPVFPNCPTYAALPTAHFGGPWNTEENFEGSAAEGTSWYSVTNPGGVSFTTDPLGNVDYATQVSLGSYLTSVATTTYLPQGNAPCTISAWVKCPPLPDGAAPATVAAFGAPPSVAAANQRMALMVSTRNAGPQGPWPLINAYLSDVAGSYFPLGSCDVGGTSTCFKAIDGLAFDSSGYLYVGDTGLHRIQRIAPGTLAAVTMAGNNFAGITEGVATSAQLNSPRQLVVVGSTLYVLDSNNNKIRTVSLLTKQTATLAGGGSTATPGQSGSASGAVDGTGTNARFSTPYGICADPTGQILYVSDYGKQVLPLDRSPPQPAGPPAGPPARPHPLTLLSPAPWAFRRAPPQQQAAHGCDLVGGRHDAGRRQHGRRHDLWIRRQRLRDGRADAPARGHCGRRFWQRLLCRRL
jgi:hypothetical protein